MAEGLSSAAAGVALTALKGAYTWAQLHTGAPGPNGTANVATEADRVQITWPGTVSNTNTMANTNLLEWTGVAGSEDYTHITIWSASSAGTFGMSGAITANPVTTNDTFQLAIGDVDVTFPVAS
jgi:hypothetical protein